MRNATGWRAALLLAFTFVAGMAAGVAADRQLGGDETAEGAKQAHEERRTDRRGGGTTIERFSDEIGLTDEQKAEIDVILGDMRDRIDSLFSPVRPAYRAIIDTSRTRIEAILTPEQVQEYRRLLDRGRRGDRRDRDEDDGERGETERE